MYMEKGEEWPRQRKRHVETHPNQREHGISEDLRRERRGREEKQRCRGDQRLHCQDLIDWVRFCPRGKRSLWMNLHWDII